MSDNELSDYENEIVGAERPKKKTKQTRTPAQLEALQRARKARSIKASKKQEPLFSLGYLTGTLGLSACALAGYYYLKHRPSASASPTKLVEKPVVKTPAPIIQNIITPIEELKDLVIKTVKETMNQETPEPVEEKQPEPIPEPTPEPVEEKQPEPDFQELARRRWAIGSKVV